MTELSNEAYENILVSLNVLTAKWEHIINLVRMSEFIIEKHQNKMPEDATNWLYGNMDLIEEFNLLHEVEQIKEQLANHTDHNADIPLGKEIVFFDEDLPF